MYPDNYQPSMEDITAKQRAEADARCETAANCSSPLGMAGNGSIGQGIAPKWSDLPIEKKIERMRGVVHELLAASERLKEENQTLRRRLRMDEEILAGHQHVSPETHPVFPAGHVIDTIGSHIEMHAEDCRAKKADHSREYF